MKFLLPLLAIVLSSAEAFSQPNKLECPCSKIGLDSLWAQKNKITCYSIPVQKNALNQQGGQFNLSVAVAPSLVNNPGKPLLYLHGGPGIATLENLPRYINSETWKLVRQTRPIIFFDYRGTGSSEPALCPGFTDSLIEFSKSNISPEARQAYKIDLYRKCRSSLLSSGIDVSSFNSFQLAEDAEAIRKALQIDQWNVYGVSFGTTVALNLLRSHGTHISSAILDSPFPPNAPWLDFVRPFDTCFKVLEKNITANPVTLASFPNIRGDFVSAVQRLNTTPARIIDSATNNVHPFSGDDFAWSIWSALLKPKAIPLVPLVIQEIAKGNDPILSKWVTLFNDPNSFGTFSDLQSKAILCYEGKPKTEADTKSALQAKYPDLSSFNIDFEGDICEAWQPGSAGEQAFAPVVSNVPVLILTGEYDPVCPPFFGEIAAQTLSRSRVIMVPSASHAAIHVDDCVRNISVDFLSDPGKNFSSGCVTHRTKINFVTGDVVKALSEYKKN